MVEPKKNGKINYSKLEIRFNIFILSICSMPCMLCYVPAGRKLYTLATTRSTLTSTATQIDWDLIRKKIIGNCTFQCIFSAHILCGELVACEFLLFSILGCIRTGPQHMLDVHHQRAGYGEMHVTRKQFGPAFGICKVCAMKFEQITFNRIMANKCFRMPFQLEEPEVWNE